MLQSPPELNHTLQVGHKILWEIPTQPSLRATGLGETMFVERLLCAR